MCGIAGFVDSGNNDIASVAERIGAAINHRGPDDKGTWIDGETRTCLIHRRLAIVDLTPSGHQPMRSASGRYVVAFNGEIYNYLELRRQLELAGRAPSWRGESDTEVLVACFDAWGITEALKALNGMFALAVFDRKERKLYLARDRMGEKPLYYGWQGSTFLFASELKAIRAHPCFIGEIERAAIPLFLRFGYVPAPWSIYSGIRKLPPGTFACLALPSSQNFALKQEPYWSVPVPRSRVPKTDEQAVEQLDALLTDAVRLRLHSDVPIGCFLSGGIDSSLVAATMQSLCSQPVRTFSIGFEEAAHDESSYAAEVARVLRTDHTELKVTGRDALALVPSLADVYDEPFADSSQIPTMLLARLTRRHVTVALSGDGGDELFGGYHRYMQGERLLRLYRAVPKPLRRTTARALAAIPASIIDKVLTMGPRKARVLLSGDRVLKFADVIARDDVHDLYGRLVSQWPSPASLGIHTHQPVTLLEEPSLRQAVSPLSWMMYMDQTTYLPDDILTKVDRATMAVALEARVPLLDHRIVEFAASLPEHQKVRTGEGKWLLRRVLYRRLDAKLFDRPKQGFGIPLAEWLRGPLRDWASDLLSEESLRRTGFPASVTLRTSWHDHLSGTRNLHYPLWTVLTLQAWLTANNLKLSV